MAGSFALRWTLTVAFALAGGYCAAQCATWLRVRRTGNAAAVAANMAHSAMSVAMIAMVWWAPSWRVITWEMAGFAVAGGWFAVRTVALGQRAIGCGVRTSPDGGAIHSKLACAHYAAAMAAMVWMLAAMLGRGGMASMPRHVGSTPASRAVTAAVLGGYFVVASALWLVVGRRRERVAGSTAHALMSAAMGTAFLTLA
jgi:hypothetical protein